ncbi:Predicted flavoprotein CzcO associated with the cation diffusion facilitator CzcD [Nocardia amikacinitolerans]|uniref:Predicted flavoprotein CzcO associated with the cation diffusion facilitator CzcD n=1 Tax=Nocardia amikacinitolerans TaxID=756689 RepID=A0A285L129_9NOCA|nr:NAD(P)/FAD-dependent oxidoreductase [Nocardia amikacinitolerans]SNY78193.1 Predicted flavoprotein CzcO associated with the cation diffusion facilitator CzcD [Nocardia amikacinitolerans]
MSQSITNGDTTPRHTRVLIVGSGLSGLGTAVRLTQEGYTDFLVIERGDDVGGTWRVNTYPGAGCDVPSQLYSYSFALNPEWSRSFSPQPEIHRYIQGIADRYGVRDKHIFGCAMTSARWNEAAARWEVETTRGKFTADVVVSAAGVLAEPNLPDIKGIHSFEGEIFHSAQWDHDAELSGKRVAVIGTGASAVQIVPSIAPQVARLDVYQRSAAWVFPHLTRRYLAPERFAFKHVPGLQRLLRGLIYANRELFVISQAKYPATAVFLELIARVKLWLEVRDPALRKRLTPKFRAGCKRLLVSNRFYPALTRDNVELVTDGIEEIRGRSIVAADGIEREVDAIVLCTGFHVADSPTYRMFTGRGGLTLSEEFETEGLQAYKGTTVAGFPNLFTMLGANSGLNYTSLIYIIESQIAYVLDALATMDKRGLRTFEVRKDVQDEYNRGLRQKMARSVWLTGGCTSWFLDQHGNNPTLWPDFSFRFRGQLRKFDVANYETTSVVAQDNTLPNRADVSAADRTEQGATEPVSHTGG